jgi:hypothetical protein
MRELKALELQAVSGAAKAPAPAPAPGVPTTLFGRRLSKKDQLVLAAVIAFLRPRPRPAD